MAAPACAIYQPSKSRAKLPNTDKSKLSHIFNSTNKSANKSTPFGVTYSKHKELVETSIQKSLHNALDFFFSETHINFSKKKNNCEEEEAYIDIRCAILPRSVSEINCSLLAVASFIPSAAENHHRAAHPHSGHLTASSSVSERTGCSTHHNRSKVKQCSHFFISSDRNASNFALLRSMQITKKAKNNHIMTPYVVQSV